ncbi:MAG: protein kinase family protein, partial [Mycobacteriaceae bacterium]|nr:protein kinase family protein [Mycobacteriaceae bacterium]
LRLLVLAVIMVPIIAGVMLAAKVPDAHAALAALAALMRRLSGRRQVAAARTATSDHPRREDPVTYSQQRHSFAPRRRTAPEYVRRGPPDSVAGAEVRKGTAVTDEHAGNAAPDATTRLPRPTADLQAGEFEAGEFRVGGFQPDDFQPDVGEPDVEPDAAREGRAAEETVVLPTPRRPAGDFAGDPTREPTVAFAARDTADSSRAEPDVHLIAGASVGDGRYRLLLSHGGPDGFEFWQALDTSLDRQVALTFVDPDGTLPPEELHETLATTLKLSRIEMPGIARVFDVVPIGAGGMVVSEWIRGGSLQEVADTAPSAIGGARAIQSLAAAADAAHRAGVALSIDHPSRIRVSIQGDVALAFPATLPEATPEHDVRGIGAVLYALLINRWPLPETGAPSGLAPAELTPDGVPIEPRAVDSEIPFQISAAAARSVQVGGGITSASTLLNLLQQATAVADRTVLIPPVEESVPAPTSRLRSWVAGGPQDEEAKARRRKGLLVGLGVAGAIIVVALLVLASVLSHIFGDVGGSLDKRNELGLNAPSVSAAPGQSTPGNIVKPIKATVFSPGGEADAPDQAGLAIDGNLTTAWSTDTYSDAVPFPNFKSGVGLLLQLPKPTTLASVGIDLSSTGTSVQIRSSQTANPSSLSDTTELTPPTPLQKGHNTISVPAAA